MTNATWANRIVGTGTEDPAALVANERNWRTHPPDQRSALAAVLDRVGYVQSVIVNKNTGRLIDGHLRVELAREHGEIEIPVVYVDLDDEEEALVLATLDPLAGMAKADADMLAALLADIDVPNESLAAVLDEIIASDAAMLEAVAADRESGHGTGARGLGNSVHQYNIVFDSAEDLQRWYGYVRAARERSATESIGTAMLHALGLALDVPEAAV